MIQPADNCVEAFEHMSLKLEAGVVTLIEFLWFMIVMEEKLCHFCSTKAKLPKHTIFNL
jgi:hypothetical protein